MCVRVRCKMRMCFAGAAVFILASGASAEDYGRPTAILVSPIHEAQVVRGDDGMDHVEYELLVVSVFPEPVTLSSVTVLDPAGKELMRMDGRRPCGRDPDALREDAVTRRSRVGGRIGRRRSDPAAGRGAGAGDAPDRLQRSRRTRSLGCWPTPRRLTRPKSPSTIRPRS